MDLLPALREQLRRYLRREQQLLDLREWLEDHDSFVSDQSVDALRDLTADVWRLISEADLGDRTEGDVWSALAELYPDLAPERIAAA